MFRKLTHFKQGSEVELDRHSLMYETFEEAKSAGLHDACRSIVVGVQIRDEDDKLLASWNNLSNYWFDYRKDNGKFIPFKEYFENNCKTVERFALREGFNIRIRKQGNIYKVYGADHVIPIEPSMLPWVSEAVEETLIQQERSEEDGVALSNKEILDMFSDYLIKRIKTALVKHPENWTSLRRSPVFS